MDFSKYRLAAAELARQSPGGVNLPFLHKSSAPVWNRLEARPRGDDLARALKAEVRDALWMLTRQWQMGELEGEDAGTPVFANVTYDCSPLRQEENAPLEATIERQPVFRPDGHTWMNLDIRAQMGSYWLELLATDPELAASGTQFVEKPEYALDADDVGEMPGGARQYLELCRHRTFDGYALLRDEARFDSFPAPQRTKLEALFAKFELWYERSFYQPSTDAENRWSRSHLEYSATASVVGKTPDPQFFAEKTLAIREYSQGHLDWYSFELASSRRVPALPPAASRMRSFQYHHKKRGTRRLLPSQVSFDGIPESRFWAFEDGGTNFASIKARKNDLARLALIEFALIYANDWSIVPIEVPIGSYVAIDALTVVDCFGKETPITSASQRQGASAKSWSFFTLDKIKGDKIQGDGAAKADGGIFYPPSLARSLQSKPLEEVHFIRDEVANMVWGIETVVVTPLGQSVSGREVRSEDRPRARDTELVYRKKTHVPASWIPFLPLKVDGRTVLRRGIIRDDNRDPIRPLTGILRYGLKGDDTWERNLDLDEREVARDGTVVCKAFQRARWTNGEVYVWLGYRRMTGKGEGSSGLSFDRLERSPG